MNDISHCLAKLRLEEGSTRVTACRESLPSYTSALLLEAYGKDEMAVNIQAVDGGQSDHDSQTQEEFAIEVEEQPLSEAPTEIEGQTETGSQANEGIQIDGQTPTEFPKFEDLPKELRLMVWEIHMQHPRIVELQSKVRTTNYRDPVNHEPFQHWVRVSSPSRQPPAILHVCKETRLEALKHYSLTNFETRDDPKLEQVVYYNLKVDIVYFGVLSDIPAMRRTLNKNILIPRVAVSVETSKVPHLTAMKVLQGEHPTVRVGLKEITFIVPSYLWLKECNFDPEACFGPTESRGVDASQQLACGVLERHIKRVQTRGLLKHAINNWTGVRIPTFEFKILQPRPESGKVYKHMLIPDENLLNKDDWLAVREIEKMTGCMIKTEPCDVDTYEDLWGSPDYELGFYGTLSAVEKAMQLVKDTLARILNAKTEEVEARRQITFGEPLRLRWYDSEWCIDQSPLITPVENKSQNTGSSPPFTMPHQPCVPLSPDYSPSFRWSYMQVPRLIEVTFRVCNFAALEVTSKARRPPAIIQVNLEARKDAKKVYSLRAFDTSGSAFLPRIFYSNSVSDIRNS
ncbi:hypothetical protein BDZ45DRAFT_747323 [Acephala macrosclerotiorum]|nr:hypothetical protein BDZ45DRAFT_747323 [Acephala macrosclerotiorum]